MADTNTPHDGFFKRLFGNLEVAADFLRNYLPAEILSLLDLDTLTLEKESFIDLELRESFSDLLFSVRTTEKNNVFIYLLLEHKSAPDFWVAFQLLRYIVQFWERLRARGSERLPLIIPIVFYHGQDRWTAPRRLGDLVELSDVPNLQRYTPDFEYDLRDFSPRGGMEIKGQPKLRAGLQLFREIFSENLGQKLPEVFRHLRGMNRADALEYARTLVAYVSGANRKVGKEEVKVAMQEAFGRVEFDKSALFIQEWIEEGREEGKEIGEHSGLCSLTLLLLGQRIGKLDEPSRARVEALSNPKLLELGAALLKFSTPADLHNWLGENATAPTPGV